MPYILLGIASRLYDWLSEKNEWLPLIVPVVFIVIIVSLILVF